MFESGIYQIVNKANNKRYIGRSANLGRRRNTHFSELRRGVHPNGHLQHAYNKYDDDAFSFSVILYVPLQDCTKVEQWFLDDWKPEYNIKTEADGCESFEHTPEAKEKIREASVAMWARMSEKERVERIKNIGAPFTGHQHSAESNAKNNQNITE